MLTFNWPWWILLLILGVQGWPVLLCLAAVLLVSAALTRGWVRWASLLAALPCVAVLGVAAWWAAGARHRDAETAAFEDRVHQVLDRDQVVNGILLPAGTEVRWRNVDRSHLGTAIPPEPITLFGLRVSWIQLADDESDWNLQLLAPETVGGWTCAEVNVRVSTTGDLRYCRLAAGRNWQRWPIPADSLLDLTTPGKIGLALPIGASMVAPEIGHNLTATGSFSLNADGSLDQFYFKNEDLCGSQADAYGTPCGGPMTPRPTGRDVGPSRSAAASPRQRMAQDRTSSSASRMAVSPSQSELLHDRICYSLHSAYVHCPPQAVEPTHREATDSGGAVRQGRFNWPPCPSHAAS